MQSTHIFSNRGPLWNRLKKYQYVFTFHTILYTDMIRETGVFQQGPIVHSQYHGCWSTSSHVVIVYQLYIGTVVIGFNPLRPSDTNVRQQTNHHWFRLRLVAWPAPSHYLNQCWNIVNSNLRNKFQWNPKWNSGIFIQENAFENVVCEMASIYSRPEWVNSLQALLWAIEANDAIWRQMNCKHWFG